MLDEEQTHGQQKQGKKKGFELSEEQKEDPYNFLGFGMVAYRDLMFTLILLFAFLSCLMYPALKFYKAGTGIPHPKNYDAFTLGNLGYSTT